MQAPLAARRWCAPLLPFLAVACCGLIGCGPGPGGAVHGVLQVQPPTQSQLGGAIDLPDFKVVLRRTGGGATSDPAPTGLAGNFVIPAGLPQGTYDLCYSGPGVPEACLGKKVQVGPARVFVGPVFVDPKGRSFVHGRITLADGSVCVHHYPAFGVAADTWVTAVDAANSSISSTVRTNASGLYAIFDVTPGPAGAALAAGVRATCEASKASAAVPSLAARVDLTFPNRSPQVHHLVARDGGEVVEWATAGATVGLEATAADPDGDPLEYHWAHTGAQSFTPAGHQATWSLLAAEARWQAVVLAGDGRGGYDFQPTDVTTGKELLRFAGVVRDEDGLPVEDVEVTINGEATQTSVYGAFLRDLSTKAERYVVNLHKVGYALTSEVFYKPVQDAEFTLHTCPGQPFDPSQGYKLVGRTKKGREWFTTRYAVILDPGSLVEKGGTAAPPGTLHGCALPITPDDELPGDYTAINGASGDFVMLESLGALWVELWDPGTGKTYDLKPGATADLEIPVDPRQAALPGGAFDFWSYEEKTGTWRFEGTAPRSGGFYRAKAKHFSVANVDIQKQDAACMRLHTDTSQLALPYELRITAPTSTGVPKTVPRTIEDDLSVIIRLPENQGVLLEVIDAGGNVINADWTQTVNSGAKVPGLADTHPPPPFPECNSDALIPPLPNLNNRFFLSEHLLEDFDGGASGVTTASEAADAYYAAIDPAGDKDTFCEWLVEAGFLPGATDCATFDIANLRDDAGFAPDAQAFYKNNGDLGFGRAMFLKSDGAPGNKDVFMFVSNYPSANNAVDDSGLIATVAMEYTPGPGGAGSRYTKFFVFNAAGTRVNNAPLDPFGPKYVPDLCVMCHGGSPADESTIHNAGSPAYPNEGRIDAKFLPFALETFVYPDIEDPTNLADPVPFDRASQEEQFRLLNEALLSTGPSAATDELIRGWYGAPAAGFTLPAVNQNSNFVPPDWGANPSLYSQVVQPSCRTCHISFGLDWADAADFSGLGGFVQGRVCQPGVVMPQSFRTWSRFWQSSNPHQPFKLKTDLTPEGWDVTQPCPQ